MVATTRLPNGLHIRGHWHWTRDLPRPWIVLTPEVRQAALSRPLSRHLLPSHAGFFPEAHAHRVRRELGIGSTIFKYCVRGEGWCELLGRRFEVRPGDLLVIPRDHGHGYGARQDRPWTIHWFHAIGDDVPHVLHELGVDAEHPVAHLGKSPALVALFEELRRQLGEAGSPGKLLYASQVLTHLLGMMIRLRRDKVGEAPDEAPDSRARVLASMGYMQDHPDRTLDLDTLASMAGVSVSHYAALFRTLTGHSPKRYFTRIRMTRAQELLAATTESVKVI